jgi:CheY-like chemotaxis protein
MTRKPPWILVVDDEPDMCWALENILRPVGYRVITATTGTEALDRLVAHEQPYAAAFIDAKLPDLDGLEVAALIRKESPHTAVFLISGYYYKEDSTVIEGLKNNLFVGFVSKPFDLKEVRRMAHRATEHAWRGESADDSHPAGR